MKYFILLWISSFLHLVSGEEKCPWKQLKDQCHPLAHPDGSDIACEVEVKNCTGEPFQCRYVGPCPSNNCMADGDETSKRERRAATNYSSRLWPSAVVPYVIEDNYYTNRQKETILDAMRHWEDKTCIRFKKKTNESQYVTFAQGFCCCSLVGRSQNPQKITLKKSGCVSFSTVVHEIGHAIGYWHEQSRPDRDEHVKIHFSRIRDGFEHNYNKLPASSVNSYSTPYDAISVMHYRESTFSKTRQRTIESKYGIPLRGSELSPIDIIQTRRVYRCPSDPKNDPPKLVPPPAPERPPELPKEAKNCGRVLTGTSGCFSTPNYPQHYPENITCGWVIPVPRGYTVNVTLEAIDLDASPPYCGDSVSVYSGIPGFGSLRRKVLCHRQISRTVVVFNGRPAYVRFESDTVKGTGTGFRGCFEVEDFDECKTWRHTRCQYRCINTQGSYECECPKGMFSPSLTKRTCLDHNECMDNNGGCSHKCINTYQSYKCTCPAGQIVGSDGKTCTTFVDHCRTAGCQHACTNTADSPVCSCRSGYTLSANGKTCNDVNECISGTHRCNHNCINTMGSYRCSCRSGNYRLKSNGRCEDINECSINNGSCSQLCRNTHGSYFCRCRKGYKLANDRQTCNDINECQKRRTCQHSCVNTVGSYRCECREGYTLSSNGYSCIDINECESSSICQHSCVNTVGSYRCECREGYTLSSNKYSCIGESVCSHPPVANQSTSSDSVVIFEPYTLISYGARTHRSHL